VTCSPDSWILAPLAGLAEVDSRQLERRRREAAGRAWVPSLVRGENRSHEHSA